MNTSLEYALRDVELEAGRNYRCQVRGQWVEIRVLGPVSPTEDSSVPSDEGMLDSWVELPEPKPAGQLRARVAPPFPPDAPDLPADDETP